MVHVCNGILLGHKNDTLPFAIAWMDVEGIMLSELSQSEKDKYIISLICGNILIIFYYLGTYI